MVPYLGLLVGEGKLGCFINVECVTLVLPSHLYILQILDRMLALECVE